MRYVAENAGFKPHNIQWFLNLKKNKLIRELRSSCNILIAFDSVLSIIYAFGHIIPLIPIFTRQLIPYSICLLIFSPALFSSEATSYMIVTIGLDRFLHVLFPIWYVGIWLAFESFFVFQKHIHFHLKR